MPVGAGVGMWWGGGACTARGGVGKRCTPDDLAARRWCFVADEAYGVYGRDTPGGYPAAGLWRIGSLKSAPMRVALPPLFLDE
jgi:hypothetical protein